MNDDTIIRPGAFSRQCP